MNSNSCFKFDPIVLEYENVKIFTNFSILKLHLLSLPTEIIIGQYIKGKTEQYLLK